MSKGKIVYAACVVLAANSGFAAADSVKFMGDVNFQSDLQANMQINLPSFDTQGGTLVLTDVMVEFIHSGSVDIAGDNDDNFQGTMANGRLVRSWTGSGPGGAFGFGNRTETTPFFNLAPNDGDGGNTASFDPTAPDGFGPVNLAYGPETTQIVFPPEAAYATPGPGNVIFDIDVLLMVNDNQFVPTAPDAWQLEVENPLLNVKVSVTYEYTPEPATLAMMAFGLLGLRRKSHRS